MGIPRGKNRVFRSKSPGKGLWPTFEMGSKRRNGYDILEMMSSNLGLKKLSVFFLAFVAVTFFSLVSGASAQSVGQSQLFITWQAHGSYVPPGYPGKALPNQLSQITASLALISGGKTISLADQTIYWYMNDTLISNTQGAQSISFSPFGGAPNFITLEAELPNYNGGLLIHTVQIPIIQPRAVIEIQHPEAQFSNHSITLQATPYFFNVPSPSSLSFAWSVNGTSPATAENPETLQLSISPETQPGASFAVSLKITSALDGMVADDSTNLVYAKQL